MNALIFLCAALLLIAGCHAADPESKPADTPSNETQATQALESKLNSHRILLLFALRDDDPTLRHQRLLIQGTPRAELQERDLAVIEVLGSAAELRSRYDVPADQPYQLLLIGKDTGVKLRRNEPVQMREIYDLIDSMPMRQREMRRDSSN